MPASKPPVPGVISVTGQPLTRQRVPYTKLTISGADLKDKDGHTDHDALSRFLEQIQDNGQDATAASRSHPHSLGTTVMGVTMTAGTLSGVTAAGTTPPTVTLLGTPTGNYKLQINITTGGALGTAVFKWSTNSGGTFQASNVTTAPFYVLGNTGVTATFSSGTYATNNVYTATASVTPVKIKHGLGEPVAHWTCRRVYPSSQAFSAVEVQFGGPDWPSTLDNKQYLLLYPTCTGTYNIEVNPG